MIQKERYYDTKWRYENHFKNDDMNEQLFIDSHEYIKCLENKVSNLENRMNELESELEEATWELGNID